MIAAGYRPPAVLIVNPYAGRLSDIERQAAIESVVQRFDVELFTTKARDSAIGIAAEAAKNGAELVIALGGDGHINEVVNGIAGTEAQLGIIPAGTMNVFARALGIPLDPHRAVDHLVSKLGQPSRMVSLGRMNQRYFTFSSGCGFDAEAAERVERYLRSKKRLGEFFFFWSAFRVLAGSYRHRNPSMLLRGPFGVVPVAMAIACNAGPYAYLKGRSINIAPDVRLEGGLDIFALRTMRLEALPLYAWRSVVTGDLVHHDDAFYESDLSDFELTAEAPFVCHTDGEPLPPTDSARFTLAKDVLRVSA
ncbi:MAG TPA: diacylglycerol kinase family protein [Actinomycetota bacterium]|nr:diacylglycerol kinase family protein [Actinomycetota bacterium]